MDKFKVKIYLETTVHGPAVRQAAGIWLIEYIKKDGTPETRQGILYRENTTENTLVLELLKEAFSKLTKTCSVGVNTKCKHVLNVMENHWLPQWEKAGWNNAKGRPVKNAELWKQCAEKMRRHYVSFQEEEHSYRSVMQLELKKELKRKDKNMFEKSGKPTESTEGEK